MQRNDACTVFNEMPLSNTHTHTYMHTHEHTFPLLLVVFMYLRVPSITVYPVCTQPADLMSPVFIYLRLLGKEGVWSRSDHVPIEGSRAGGETWRSSLRGTVCVWEL